MIAQPSPKTWRIAILATFDLCVASALFSFLVLALLQSAAGTTVIKDPPTDPPPLSQSSPNTASFVAQEIHQRLIDLGYPDVGIDLEDAVVVLPGIFALGDWRLRQKSCGSNDRQAILLCGPCDAQPIRVGQNPTDAGCLRRGDSGLVAAAELVDDISSVLNDVLPSFVDANASNPLKEKCRATLGKGQSACPGHISVVYLEGHADRWPFDANSSTNDALSLQRALGVYVAITKRHATLATLSSTNPNDAADKRVKAILAPAGFGCRRPSFNIDTASRFTLANSKINERCPDAGNPSDPGQESKNRRLEIRIVVS
jgi:hypothetical protein